MDDIEKPLRPRVFHPDHSVKQGKMFIDKGSGVGFVEEHHPYIDPYVFQKLFTHCCLRADIETANALHEQCYLKFRAVDKIALRPAFAHGKYIVPKGTKNEDMIKWLTTLFSAKVELSEKEKADRMERTAKEESDERGNGESEGGACLLTRDVLGT